MARRPDRPAARSRAPAAQVPRSASKPPSMRPRYPTRAMAPPTARPRRSRAARRGPGRGGVLSSCGRAAAVSTHASRSSAVDAQVAQPRRPRERAQPRRRLRRVLAERGRERRVLRREAPPEGRDRVRQQDRVGLSVTGQALAHQRLRQHVVQPVAGAVERVAREQRAERERVAVGLGPREGAGQEPRGLVRRRASRPGSRPPCTAPRPRARARSRALAASSPAGWEAASPGS